MIRVLLPHHLGTLAGVGHEIELEMEDPVTVNALCDALEARCPVLKGTFRDAITLRRRPFIRFYAGGEDYSHLSPETLLPEAVATGKEPFFLVGAMAGG
ncbi:MAG: MoaD/ThiS family protein [Actinomycetota bacterium]|nr:MoaD/ThiS family protein [Actinomycetota bacterium]